MTKLEWTDDSFRSREGKLLGMPQFKVKVGVEAWFRIHGYYSTRSGRDGVSLGLQTEDTPIVAWDVSFIDITGYCNAGSDYRRSQGYRVYFAKDDKYQQKTDLFWERNDKWFFDTFEEAQAHAESVLGYLKRTYPKAFTEKDDTDYFTGVDWVHDGYV